jgi:hypothetical protein
MHPSARRGGVASAARTSRSVGAPPSEESDDRSFSSAPRIAYDAIGVRSPDGLAYAALQDAPACRQRYVMRRAQSSRVLDGSRVSQADAERPSEAREPERGRSDSSRRLPSVRSSCVNQLGRFVPPVRWASRQLIVDVGAEAREWRPRSRPQRPRLPANTRELPRPPRNDINLASRVTSAGLENRRGLRCHAARSCSSKRNGLHESSQRRSF